MSTQEIIWNQGMEDHNLFDGRVSIRLNLEVWDLENLGGLELFFYDNTKHNLFKIKPSNKLLHIYIIYFKSKKRMVFQTFFKVIRRLTSPTIFLFIYNDKSLKCGEIKYELDSTTFPYFKVSGEVPNFIQLYFCYLSYLENLRTKKLAL
jgi:hypothetical protein